MIREHVCTQTLLGLFKNEFLIAFDNKYEPSFLF